MDPATLIGIVVALVAVFVSMTMSGMNPIGIFFADIGSIILVLGGSIGVSLASGTLAQAVNGLKVSIKAFLGGKPSDPAAVVDQLVGFADVARKEGLLSLESRLDEVEDPFLRQGLALAVDGTDPEVLREMLEIELEHTGLRHREAAGFWTTCAGFSPAMGMIGTVIGLISMLGNLEDPSSLGPSMAVAFLTTLWGAFLANFFFSPMASKLRKMSNDEIAQKELVLEGILAIQAGSNPRAVAGKLVTFLPPASREGILNKDAKSA
jgi:chemotaxis protein MotA